MGFFKRSTPDEVRAAPAAPPPPARPAPPNVPARAPALALQPLTLWSQHHWCNQDVVGETHRLETLRSLFPMTLPENAAIDTIADLVPEPTNPHDGNAVQVRVNGQLVGFLPREIAGSYQPLLLALVRRSLQPQVSCTLRAWEWESYTYDRNDREIPSREFRCDVRIALDEPHLCVPANDPPQVRHIVFPDGNAIQVTGEENHLDAIGPFLRPEGAVRAYATLHPVLEQRKTPREVVEVRLDGRRVGQLTPKMSGDLLPAIHHVESAGYIAAARSIVRGNRLKAEVTLYAARAHELPADWPEEVPGGQQPTSDATSGAAPHLNAPPVSVLVTHAPIPRKPTHVRFNPPAAWPIAPGWEPPAGWQPEAEWPPAPAGWHFWVIDGGL